MERWDGEKLCIKNSEEFKYLDSIDDVIDVARDICKMLDEIDKQEYYKIKRNEIIEKVNLEDINKLLIDVRKKLKNIKK